MYPDMAEFFIGYLLIRSNGIATLISKKIVLLFPLRKRYENTQEK
jgi:hypothetical protein